MTKFLVDDLVRTIRRIDFYDGTFFEKNEIFKVTYDTVDYYNSSNDYVMFRTGEENHDAFIFQ